jgi:hypothetical protein
VPYVPLMHDLVKSTLRTANILVIV